MTWTSWVLAALILLPMAGGVLSGLIRHDRLRNALVALLAVAIASGGIALVYLSQHRMAPGSTWNFAVPAVFGEWCGVLELAMIALMLGVAIYIRHPWITLFGVLQAILTVSGFFVPSTEGETVTLFSIDNLSRIMLIVSSCVGGLILLFSIGYMTEHAKHAPPGAGSLQRFYFVFLSFLGLMIGLVVSHHLALFSFFWEGTTLCSYALIGQDGGKARTENAIKALMINSFGGVLLIAGILVLKVLTGEETFTALFANASVTMIAAVLLVIAAFTKSALFPFQSWLLGAMVAPTPVSAMLHAATMVKAGVYLVMRIAPGYIGDTRMTMVIAFMGSLSFVGGALLACTQSNAKRVLAYSTISNLGLVVACAGIDAPLAYAAGLAIISFHAISKGLLFLCVGRIEQKIGSRDIEDMDGLLYKMPFTTCVILLGMMSMLLPPFGMLLSKWLAIEATIRSPFLLVFMVLGSALTVLFWAKWIGRMQHIGYHRDKPSESMPFSMRFSLGLMAVLVLGTGLSTMWLFHRILAPMAQRVFSAHPAMDWTALEEAQTFPATVLFGFVALALLLHYFFCWHRFKSDWVRLPFLCGENVTTQEVNADDDVRSYDFHSIGGKIEHSHVTSYYFRNIISETIVTGCLKWAAWLIIVVLIGNTLTMNQ